MENHFKLSVVVPCFNEQESLLEMYGVLSKELSIYENAEVIFVDDGSKDATLAILKQLNRTDKRVQYISFSRNFGHQNALKAGLNASSGDCVVSLDADLQQPPALIHEMVKKWQEGYEIVYTIRTKTENSSWFKRTTSHLYYKIINWLSEVKIEDGAADFRLLDKKVVDVLREFNESFLFMRGVISYLGFKQYAIEYEAADRFAGTSKYTFVKMLRFAMTGITSFSIKPLKLSMLLGFVFAILSFLFGCQVFYEAVFTDKTVDGWATVVLSILLIGGINLIMLGIIGEYIGKMFLETKRRPNYIVRETSLNPKEDTNTQI
jgi:dolichol-phosphate mannosyltransferase